MNRSCDVLWKKEETVPRKIRIVHTADLHLGSPFSTLPAARAAMRRDEQWRTFYDIVSICRERKAQILLIAGDLLDAVRISSEQSRAIIRAFTEIPDTRVFISPGNHDPYIRFCPYEAEEWPSNVHVFSGNFEPVVCSELNTVVWGAAFRSAHNTSGLCPPDFEVTAPEGAKSDAIQLIVLHGELLSGSKSESSYNPIRTSWIEKSNADYAALGHIHDATPVRRSGRTYFAYSGCPEARGYDEPGPRGVYVGTVGKGRTDLEYVIVNRRDFYTLDVSIDGCDTQKIMTDLVLRDLRDQYREEFKESAFRITLIGAVPPDFSPDVAALRAALRRECFDARVYDKTTAQIDPAMLRKEKSLRGVFAEILGKRREEAVAAGDEAAIRKIDAAMKLGLASFEKEVRYHDDS